jgi:hypothetical protein
MSAGGAFLRAITALILGVFVFLAFGYFVIANGVRDVLYDPGPVLSALESHDGYNRVYDDGIIGQQFEGTFKRLVGGFSLDVKTEASLLKQVFPPSELRSATEENVISIVAFLKGESEEFDASIDLAPAIPRIKPAVLALLDERIDQADLATIASEAALRTSLQDMFRGVASGDVPDTIPALAGVPEDQVFRAYLQAVDSLAGSTLSSAALANLDQEEQAITEAFRQGDIRAALKLVTRAIAGDAVDSAIVELRNDLDRNDRFDAVDKIAESVGTRQETLERFRLIRTSLGLLTGLVGTVALAIVIIGVLAMAAVFHWFARHMIRWPGVTLIFCGLSYLIVSWSISALVGPWESAWCSFVDASSCNLAVDVGSELLSNAGDALTMPSIIATLLGIVIMVGAHFAPDHWSPREQQNGNNRQ